MFTSGKSHYCCWLCVVNTRPKWFAILFCFKSLPIPSHVACTSLHICDIVLTIGCGFVYHCVSASFVLCWILSMACGYNQSSHSHYLYLQMVLPTHATSMICLLFLLLYTYLLIIIIFFYPCYFLLLLQAVGALLCTVTIENWNKKYV